ncbi:TetR/AcrR family transcriptional regulator [uncultured Psychrobacillus sp.]|uniref:TetR/AcrR family transcriptional regulator n=1 Tax=uncultured Psychrobacillus sp. TaxID=1551585 RepID=UPI00260F81B4|nr:TetR/AcrR family transcriptional regulator [uncultured Psychrobacillus sp.]
MNAENSTVDRRVRRTKKIFKSHFIELVKEKGYKNVTVTDVVERADYNRSTFYIYYKDKEDLAEELVLETLKDLEYAFHSPFLGTEVVDYRKIISTSNAFFKHLYDHRSVYSLLYVKDSIPGFQECFLNKFKEIFYGITYLNESNEVIGIKHFNTYKMYGSYGVIIEWLQEGCIESPEEIADTLLEIFKTSESAFKLDKPSNRN